MPALPKSDPPSPPPREKSGLVWWLLGLLVVGVTVLGVGMLFTARVLTPPAETIVTRPEPETPPGARPAPSERTLEHDLPVYPGAEVTEEPDVVEVIDAQGESVFIVSARYRVRATVEEVDAWYRQKLDRNDFEREPPGEILRRRNLFGVPWALQDILYIDDKEQRIRVVVLHAKGPDVEITLARISRADPD